MQKKIQNETRFKKKVVKIRGTHLYDPLFAGVGGTTAACCPDGLPHLAMSPAYVQNAHTKSTRKAIKKEKKYANTA